MRQVRIATVAFLVEDRFHSIPENLERAIDYVRQSKAKGADVVCLPEMVATANVAPELETYAEAYPGEFTRAFRDVARAEKINLIAPYLVRTGGKIFNQATVINRKGEVEGFYRKVQPTGAESQKVTAGSTLPVFKMDFGTIAVMICMDIYFAEIPRIYAFKGAEVVFWPTISHGPTQESLRSQLMTRAMDNSLVMVESNLAGHPPYAPYSGRFRPATARIIDHNGDVIAQTGRRHGIAFADVDLDEPRLTSNCVLIREPDHMKEDLKAITRLDLYGEEYLRLAKKQKRYY